eukprot:CAMPEP_0197594678 /NCGR_PEP_ID=MMETSP1326-20131121/21168_1 /TAXON_ID=1155430 /ORGANISM="Genus nov. species nov., Strain RCC2288" /LENGTH=76 /DNA_ID=CAMNT_0043160907 /DNA_START=8 /DNA_END=235 /DNA_ORIENTATION=-
MGKQSAAAAAAPDVVWEFEPEASAAMRLHRGQRTNHFPGMGALTAKTGLAELLATDSTRSISSNTIVGGGGGLRSP